jgi:copper homeostasis protein
MPCLLEVCIDSVGSARAASEVGADRLEVNSALVLGGLTPSAGMFTATRAAVQIPLVVMIRPRPGGFQYAPEEIDAMTRDVEMFAAAGADAFCFGALDAAGDVDREACKRIMEAADGKPCVFHRAFDVCSDPSAALADLVDLGFARILTAGGAYTAERGLASLVALCGLAAGKITVLPGGGIRAGNVESIVSATGAKEVHASCARFTADPTVALPRYPGFGPADKRAELDVEKLMALRTATLGLS